MRFADERPPIRPQPSGSAFMLVSTVQFLRASERLRAPLLRDGRRRRAPRQRSDVAYSISSSAAVCSAVGMLIPSCLAVLALMANVNLVGCSIGRSPGLVPCMILPA